MRHRQKNYWSKKKETFNEGKAARQRAALLRTYEHIEHVHMDKEGDLYVVTYSAATWWLDALSEAKIKI